MNKYYPFILTILLLCFVVRASAETLSYTFISANYSLFTTKLDGYTEDLDGDTFGIDASIAVRPNIALVASYSAGSADFSTEGSSTSADISSTSLGLVVHLPVNEKTDFILGVSFFNGDIDVHDNAVSDNDADGGMTQLGFRSMVSDKLELNAYVRRKSVEDKSHIGIKLGSAFYINETFSVDAGFTADSESRLVGFGVTKYF